MKEKDGGRRVSKGFVYEVEFASDAVLFESGFDSRPCFLEVLFEVLREEGGEGTDFEHATFVPRRVELLDLPVVDVGVIVPWLGFIVLPLSLLLLLRFFHLHAILVLFKVLHRCYLSGYHSAVASVRFSNLCGMLSCFHQNVEVPLGLLF